MVWEETSNRYLMVREETSSRYLMVWEETSNNIVVYKEHNNNVWVQGSCVTITSNQLLGRVATMYIPLHHRNPYAKAGALSLSLSLSLSLLPSTDVP